MAVKGPKPRDAVMPFLRDGSLAARLTALGYFYAAGKARRCSRCSFRGRQDRVPKTDDPEAKWQCEVPKADGKENEIKDIKDVGDFVRFCVTPAMKARVKPPLSSRACPALRCHRADTMSRIPTRNRLELSSAETSSGTPFSRWRWSSNAPSTTSSTSR